MKFLSRSHVRLCRDSLHTFPNMQKDHLSKSKVSVTCSVHLNSNILVPVTSSDLKNRSRFKDVFKPRTVKSGGDSSCRMEVRRVLVGAIKDISKL